ncbi:unnamed protein product, partial [Choristocarpus tenellus]
MLNRRSSVAKNQLLNLAFEDDQAEPIPDEPKGLPANLFKEGIREHAAILGMTLPEDEQFLWVAEESLLAPLPEGWVQLREEDSGHPYYYNE